MPGYVAIGGLSVSAQTLGQLLASKTQITVPMYQRPYSWTRTHIDTLIDDMEAEINKPNKNQRALFLGTVVFNVENADGHESVDLIDGQQRLVTLALIQNWWLRELSKFESTKGGAVQHMLREMLFNDDLDNPEDAPDSELREKLRLVPAQTDQANFQSLVRRGKAASSGRFRISTSFKVLEDKFNSMCLRRAKLEGVDPASDETRYQQIVVNVADAIKDLMERRMTFGVIEVREPLNPFAVFESLNSKGLELAASDLIKNFLLKQLPQSLRQDALTSWDAMVDTVPQDKIVDFLRAWYIANHGLVQRAHLYPAFRTLLQSRQSINRSLEAWNEAAWWFRSLADGKIHDSHPAFQGKSPQPVLQRALRRWEQLGFKQGVAVLLAFVANEQADSGSKEGQLRVARAMELLEAAYVRLFVTRNVRGSVFEAKLDQMCGIGRTQGTTSNDNLQTLLFAMCRDEGVGDELDWSTIGRSVNEARYLLYRMAEHQCGDALQLLGPDKWHVEHILPQTKPGGHPNELEKAEYEAVVSRIGNLTLLLGSDNTSLKNAAYDRKIVVFSAYDGRTTVDEDEDPATPEVTRPPLALNHEIPQHWPDQWNAETIKDRGRQLGQYASRVWRLAPE